MQVDLILVPYDSGRRGERMGAGPERLLEAGLAQDLRAAGCDVDVHAVELEGDAWPGEVQSAVSLAAGVAARVRHAQSRGAFPLIISGNCAPAALGAIAGLGQPRVCWFDAHADLNTPETTTSGFFDGMALAVATGRCWRTLAATIPGFAPVPDSSVLLIGARDIDALEQTVLEEAAVPWVRPGDLRSGLAASLRGMAGTRAYVHLDLDVLDPSQSRVNRFAAPDGLSVDDVEWCVGAIARESPIAAAALTAYDPAVDPQGGTPAHASRLAQHLVECIR